MSLLVRLLFACLLLAAGTPQAAETLTLGVFSYRPKPITEAKFRPLVEYLNDEVKDVRFELQVLSQADIERTLPETRIDLLITNPSHYLAVRSKVQLTGALATLISIEDGHPTQTLGGVIFTAAANDTVHGLADLRGRKIAVPGTKWLGGYQTQAFELLQEGIRLPEDARVIETGSHDAVVDAVLAGEAEVGFVRTGIFESLAAEGSLDIAQVRVVNPQEVAGFPYLVSTRLYPEWPFVALPHVDQRVVRRIASALMGLEPDHPAAQAAHIAGFAPPADYLQVEELARTLRITPFDHPPAITWPDIWNHIWRPNYRFVGLALTASLALAALLFVLLLHRHRALVHSLNALRREKERNRHYLDTVQTVMVALDRNGRVTMINRAGCELLGYTERELLGRDWFTRCLPQPEGVEVVRPLVMKMLSGSGEGVDYYESGVLCRDGGRRLIAWRNALLPDDAGQGPGIIGSGQDITERKRMESVLRQSEERLRTIIATEPECIKVVDRDGRLVQMNPAGLRMVEAERPEQVVGKSVFKLIAPEYRQEFIALHQRVMAGESLHMEFEVEGLKGGHRWLETHAVPMRDGEALVQLAVTRDISERKRAEAELLQAKERAESANRAKSAFLANMSHELRTPLNAMLGFAQILQRDSALNEEERHQVETILRSGDHLLTLINDILDLARIEAGRLELVTAPCNLRAVLLGLDELFRFRAEAKGIAFQYVEISPLPGMVEADERRLRQIVLNLLGNAVKFTERGEVRLEAGYAEGVLSLAVSDTGIGIAPERIAGLFRPFQQEGSAAYRNQGTGLGLAISRQLVEQMGGEIAVESTPGQGSRFTVGIPLPALAEGAGEGVSPLAAIPRGYRRRDGRSGPLRVLLVDDLEDNRMVARQMLEPLGFAVEEAVDGESALEASIAHRPDLVLMDLVMPGLSGLEATRRLHALPGLSELPVIACSASAFEEDRANSMAAGCCGHLAKPVRMPELLSALERLLGVEWIMGPMPGAAKPSDGAEIERPLAPEQREQLLALARRGDVGGIRRYLDGMSAGGGGLVARLREAAVRFDIKGLRRILESG